MPKKSAEPVKIAQILGIFIEESGGASAYDRQQVALLTKTLKKWVKDGYATPAQVLKIVSAMRWDETREASFRKLLEEKLELSLEQKTLDLSSLKIYETELKGTRQLEEDETLALIEEMRAGREALDQLERDAGTLTEEEAAALRRSARRGEEARQEAIIGNLQYVISRAKSMMRKNNYQGTPLHDLIQGGNEGLIKAIDRFNITKATNHRFFAYAAKWVNHGIAVAHTEIHAQVKMTKSIIESGRQIKMTNERFAQVMGRTPTSTELASIIGMEEEQVLQVKQAMTAANVMSLDTKIPDSGDQTVGNILKSNDEPLDEMMERKERQRTLRRAFYDYLDPIEEKVIVLRYGMEDGKSHSLEEIGYVLHYTRENIRLAERRAIAKLREAAEIDPGLQGCLTSLGADTVGYT